MSRLFVMVLGCLIGISVMDSAVVVASAPSEAPAAQAEADPEGGHGEHAQGVPMNFKSDLALWSLVTFVVFLIVLRKLAWIPMIEGLDKRESTLRQQAAETQHALEKAKSLLSEHEQKLNDAQNEVREMIAEAKRDAERTGQDIVSAAQAEAEAMRARAVEDIGHARDAALKEIFDAVADQVASATEHVLGRALNEEDQNRLVQEALQQVAGS